MDLNPNKPVYEATLIPIMKAALARLDKKPIAMQEKLVALGKNIHGLLFGTTSQFFEMRVKAPVVTYIYASNISVQVLVEEGEDGLRINIPFPIYSLN